MRLPGRLLVSSLLVVPAAAQAAEVDTGGPYQVEEGGEVELTVVVSDFVGEVHYAWDLDADGVFDDGDEATVTFSAVGIEPGWVTVSLVVSDDVGQALVSIDIVIGNENELPQFRNVPNPRAVVGREWSWTPDVVDAEGDPFELTVDAEDMPAGMVFDGATLRWTPQPDALLRGNPLGHYAFRVWVDENHRHVPCDVALQVVENRPPPSPGLAYPDPVSDEVIVSRQPTIVIRNVDDPDGDALTYHVVVDSNICFCSPERMDSGPISEGELATQWRLPRPFQIEPGVEKTYCVRIWVNDGLADSDTVTSCIGVLWPEDGGDGDADSDGDADVDGDADADGDADEPDDWKPGCSCDIPGLGAGGRDAGAIAVPVLFAGLVFVRRRTPQNHR